VIILGNFPEAMDRRNRLIAVPFEQGGVREQ
jgi:hypothetical protein